MLEAIVPTALIAPAVRVVEDPIAVHLAFVPVAFVGPAIRPVVLAPALHEVLPPGTIVTRAVFPDVLALSVLLALLVVPLVLAAVDSLVAAEAMLLVALPLALVDISVSPDHLSIAIPKPVEPLPDVDVAIFIAMLPELPQALLQVLAGPLGRLQCLLELCLVHHGGFRGERVVGGDALQWRRLARLLLRQQECLVL